MTLQSLSTADLELSGVTKAFGAVVAVNDVSASIKPGEFYSVLGPSGCGKTTTLRLIAGFEGADRGRILLAGQDITRTPPDKRRVNTVFQQYALFPHLTVEANVAYGLRHAKLPKDVIARRLESGLGIVRLAQLRERYPRELSGGQQQRVALARALVNEPQVLLLDEPLAALDLKLRKAMQQELKKLQKRVGISFVYVTHDQEEALTLSDRIAVMNDGKILQEGPPSEIYERPTTRFVADFIGETNFFEGTVEETGTSTVVRDAAGRVFRCAPAGSVHRGMQVSVSIRPEAIAPVTPESRPANIVEGILQRTVYLGDAFQHVVLLDDGMELVVRRQNDEGSRELSWTVGDLVQVGWSESSALAVRDEGASLADQDERHLMEAEAIAEVSAEVGAEAEGQAH